MAHRRSSTVSSIVDTFSLNPLPYPVILILGLIFIFMGLQWYSLYESVVETAEQNMGWALFVIPVILLFAAIWLSTLENPERFFTTTPYDRQSRTYYPPSEGSSPWVVAALIVLLLFLVQYQSVFHDSWFV